MRNPRKPCQRLFASSIRAWRATTAPGGGPTLVTNSCRRRHVFRAAVLRHNSPGWVAWRATNCWHRWTHVPGMKLQHDGRTAFVNQKSRLRFEAAARSSSIKARARLESPSTSAPTLTFNNLDPKCPFTKGRRVHAYLGCKRASTKLSLRTANFHSCQLPEIIPNGARVKHYANSCHIHNKENFSRKPNRFKIKSLKGKTHKHIKILCKFSLLLNWASSAGVKKSPGEHKYLNDFNLRRDVSGAELKLMNFIHVSTLKLICLRCVL